jgi:hypothetical protein
MQRLTRDEARCWNECITAGMQPAQIARTQEFALHDHWPGASLYRVEAPVEVNA